MHLAQDLLHLGTNLEAIMSLFGGPNTVESFPECLNANPQP